MLRACSLSRLDLHPRTKTTPASAAWLMVPGGRKTAFQEVRRYPCRVAHPPYVGFIARLRPRRLPDSDARKLSSSTNNLLEWVLPPLVICAVEAPPVKKVVKVKVDVAAILSFSLPIPKVESAITTAPV